MIALSGILLPPISDGYAWVRARYRGEDAGTHLLGYIENFVLNNRMGSIAATGRTQINDMRPSNGEFVKVNGIFLYEDAVLLQGLLLYRDRVWPGFEMSAKRSVLEERLEQFLAGIDEGGLYHKDDFHVGKIH